MTPVECWQSISNELQLYVAGLSGVPTGQPERLREACAVIRVIAEASLAMGQAIGYAQGNVKLPDDFNLDGQVRQIHQAVDGLLKAQ